MSEGLLRPSDVKLAFNYITAALIRQPPLKAVTETLRNNREAVILVGVKQNVKHFFRGLYEANLAAQKEVRGFGHFDIR